VTPDRRPSFARDFPRTAALDAIVDAFARGDYARVRSEAPKLAESATEDEVRLAARALLERTRPDPTALALLALTAALLLVLSAWWIVHGKPPPGSNSISPPARSTPGSP